MQKMMLCDPSEVRVLSYSTNSDYSFDDPRFVGCIAIASEQIEKYTRRKFAYGTRYDYFDVPAGVGYISVYTSGIPVDGSTLGVGPVLENGGGYFDGSGSAAISLIDPDSGHIHIGRGPYSSKVRIGYSAGWKPREDQPTSWGTGYLFYDVPVDLRMATAIQASFLMQRFMKNDVGKRGDEGSTVAKESVYNISPDAAKMLDTYIRPRYMGVI